MAFPAGLSDKDGGKKARKLINARFQRAGSGECGVCGIDREYFKDEGKTTTKDFMLNQGCKKEAAAMHSRVSSVVSVIFISAARTGFAPSENG